LLLLAQSYQRLALVQQQVQVVLPVLVLQKDLPVLPALQSCLVQAQPLHQLLPQRLEWHLRCRQVLHVRRAQHPRVSLVI
jgi:hypothetical protein